MSDELVKSTKRSVSKLNRELKKLRRIREKGWVGGVCAGVAYRLGVPTWAVRMGLFLSAVFYGFGLGAYILLWIFVPGTDELPGDFEKRAG